MKNVTLNKKLTCQRLNDGKQQKYSEIMLRISNIVFHQYYRKKIIDLQSHTLTKYDIGTPKKSKFTRTCKYFTGLPIHTLNAEIMNGFRMQP